MNVIFLGPPGAGKGTHAARAAAALGVPHVSTGDMLRESIAEGAPEGLEAKGFIDRGDLVPDGLVNEIARRRLSRPDCAAGFVLDGYPRTLEQAESLGAAFPIHRVLSIELNDTALIERIAGRRLCEACKGIYNVETIGVRADCPACGARLFRREDDDPAVVANRLAVYHRETSPLREYYRRTGALRAVVSDRSVDEVSKDILAALPE